MIPKRTIYVTILIAFLLVAMGARPIRCGETTSSSSFVPVEYRIVLEKPFCHDDGKFIWFHPRVAPLPQPEGPPKVLLTFQKHLEASDYYSGLSYKITPDLAKTWNERVEPRELAWREEEGGDIVIGVCDVTPGWHAPTGKVLATGVRLRYRGGQQVGAYEAGYAVFDPATESWTDWRAVATPEREGKFNSVAPGCTQWIVEEDGTILLPVYFHGVESPIDKVTVLRCSFDGESLAYLDHGDEIAIESARGAHEPSIVKFDGTYYLTIRTDERGYVTRGTDGLHFDPVIPWTFDDGQALGSYNTQQHWLAHSEGLFLTYTRSGANNDHVFRHRAPLFIAQVDPAKLQVVRATEKILLPDRGATFGNFGATAIDENESWVTDAEGMWGEARERGAEGCVYVARVIWDKPNELMKP